MKKLIFSIFLFWAVNCFPDTVDVMEFPTGVQVSVLSSDTEYVETESDTLQSVTDRGATTTNEITTGGVTITTGNNLVVGANTLTVSDKLDGEQIGDNTIDEDSIDWGTATDQVSAVDIPIADAGNKIAGTEVETALQENRTAIDLNTAHAADNTQAHSDYFLNSGGDIVGAGTYNFGEANVVLEIPNAASPTTDATGEIAIDTDLITQGMLQVYLASALCNVVATTDTPGDNEIPKYDSGTGTITWETDATGAGGGVATLKEATVQVGDADIASLDFGAGFDLAEDPDTEINITLDLSEIAAGGELGGNMDAPTIDDSVAVSNWNLTTPTITTSLTTSTPTTISVAELDRLDGLAGVIVTDATACTDIEGTGLSIGAGTLNWSAASTDLTDTADLLYETELDAFSELQTQIADKTLVNTADGAVWLGTHDFGGAVLELPNGASPTVDNLGEMAIDSTSGQVKYYDTAERILHYQKFGSVVIENLAAADDSYEIGMWNDAVTITHVGVHCRGTCTTGAQISLEDRAGNAMTHDTPTASTGTNNTTFVAVTANNTLVAGEGLAFDVDNAVSPETDEYTITIGWVYTSD